MEDVHVHGRSCLEDGCAELAEPVLPPARPERRWSRGLLAGVAALALLTGAAVVLDDDPEPPPVVDAGPARAPAPPPAPAPAPPAAEEEAPAGDTGFDAVAEALTAPRPVPDVAGLTLLEAQKALLVEEFLPQAVDASGSGRIPVLGTRWRVLSQEPAAGTVLPPGRRITLTVERL